MGFFVRRPAHVMTVTFAVLDVLVCLTGVPAVALDPNRGLTQLHHDSWSKSDGVPTVIQAITQTPDGFLWLGSAEGLYRFDGIRTEPVAVRDLRGAQVASLATSANGDLWAGLGPARLVRIRGDKVTAFDVPAQGVASPAFFLTTDPDGSIWMATRETVMNFDGLRWRVIEDPWPGAATWSQPGGVWALEVGRDGTLWSKNLLGLYYLRRGAGAFEQAPDYAGGLIGFARDGDGRLWTADLASRRFYALPDLVPDEPIPKPDLGAAVPPSIFGTVLLDRDGAVWNANRITGGLYRSPSLAASGAAERFTVPQGLTSDLVFSIFEDREGSIWAATERGLDRFRHANIVYEPSMRVRLQAAQLVASKEAVFLYSGMSAPVADPEEAGRRLFRIRQGQPPDLVVPDVGQLQASAALSGEELVFASENGLARWRRGVVSSLKVSAEIQGGHVRNLAATRTGEVLVSVFGKGVYRFDGAEWSRITLPATHSDETPAIALDDADAAWLFYPDDLIVRVDDDRISTFDSVVREIGIVRATLADQDGLLLVADHGVARFDGRGFQLLPADRAPVFASCFGIARGSEDDLWIGTEAGIVRIARSALLSALAGSELPLEYRLFDVYDGFTGRPPGDVFNNSMVAGPDGRIWFLTNSGVAWIAPDQLHRNEHPPPVVVTAVRASGRSYSMPQGLFLPAGASSLEIDYTALSLVAPERVNFRYRLIGVDSSWVEAGGRRQAFYTNVSPGEYSFQVLAANNDGVWNETGTTLWFSIAPTFFQSIWFNFLVALAVGAIVWIAYTVRVRHVTAQLQSQFEVRIAERERIARELHDTLLQGFQGLLLQFQSLANRIPTESALRQLTEEALERAEAVLVDGRKRVRDLRTETSDLAQALVDAAGGVIHEGGPRFQLTVEGPPRTLHAFVTEEVLRIGEEAIRNAVDHANARTIEAVLTFGRESLQLAIRDDGVGIPQWIQANGERAGHFGLVGMRERAERINGHVVISSRRSAGTQVLLIAPARSAYRDRSSWVKGLIRRVRPGGSGT